MIYCANRYSITSLLTFVTDLLHWLPVLQRVEYKMCVLVYECLHQSAPIYLSELCIPVAATVKRSHLGLRSAVPGNLVMSYTAGQSDMDKEALPIPGLLYRTHFR